MELQLLKTDPYLKPFKETITGRYKLILAKEKEFTGGTQKLSDCVNGHNYYGLHKIENGWVFREWAPNATQIFLTGEFNNWRIEHDYELKNIGNGNWEIYLPAETIKHYHQYLLFINWQGGSGHRIPVYTNRVVQDMVTKTFNAQVWDPPKPYEWKNQIPPKHKAPIIYEAHVGMSSSEAKVESYDGFRRNILPRIAKAGYNTIQFMAIMEHAYYGSFGYHVSNFFAVSSRSGTPDELKQLIDDAHGMGISVIMDIVHSHAVKNEVEGISRFDGTLYQFFHDGPRGMHQAWDSRCFDYNKNEVIHFLLSNCKYWIEEYRFDGYRFDGVTSMIYLNHGLGSNFVSYNQYFDLNQDEDAIVYLALANKVIHQVRPEAITIAEEMSGYPGLSAPIEDGGLGFDYRLSMGTPDFWINQIKNQLDEQWHVGDMFFRLSDKRIEEKVISYAESHDQALVGEQTISFRLMGSSMYNHMTILDRNFAVERGVALHKMIRLLTISCAGGGYLNFMGNEFGHPEWIDFPREGNNWSHYYARRQWNLADNPELKYFYLNEFDHDMIHLIRNYEILSQPKPEAIDQNINYQVLIFKRGDLFFIFNFNPVRSYTDYGFLTAKGDYKIVLNTDSFKYVGQNRIDEKMTYKTIAAKDNKRKHYLHVYIPAHTAIVMKKEK